MLIIDLRDVNSQYKKRDLKDYNPIDDFQPITFQEAQDLADKITGVFIRDEKLAHFVMYLLNIDMQNQIYSPRLTVKDPCMGVRYDGTSVIKDLHFDRERTVVKTLPIATFGIRFYQRKSLLIN